MSAYYDFEAGPSKSALVDDSPSLVHESCVSILCNGRWIVIEAYPSWGHNVGVYVVKQIFHREVFHPQIEAFVELLSH